MASDIIDFIASFAILITVLGVVIYMSTQTLDNALVYQQNQLVSSTATETFNTIIENPGSPSNWGETGDLVTGFGLQWASTGIDSLSPFTPLRLLESPLTVIYDGVPYRDLSDLSGTSLLLKTSEQVTYDEASQLLSLKGKYGWRLMFDPVLDVAVTAWNPPPPTDWYGGLPPPPGWSYRTKVIIDHTKVLGNFNNYPVLLSITDTDLKTYAQSTGFDIVFTDADGVTKLNHEIESYDSSTGKLIVWVNVPSLSPWFDTELYMYFGNAAAPDQQDPAGTWNTSYLLVSHMKDDPDNSHVADSTANNLDGTKSAAEKPVQSLGEISYTQRFDGSTAAVTLQQKIGISTTLFTFDFWAKSTAQQQAQTILSTGAKSNSAGFFDITRSPSSYDLSFDYASNSAWLEKGLPILDGIEVKCLAYFNAKIYAGTGDGRLYEWDGSTFWTLKASQLVPETRINSLVVFNNILYGGTGPNGKLYEWDGSGAWISRATLGAGTDILSLAVFNSKLYGGTSNGKLLEWTTGATVWTERAPQLGAETSIYSLISFGSPAELYGCTGPNGKLYKWNGAGAWLDQITPASIHSTIQLNGKIYGGTSSGELYEWDSTDLKWVRRAPQLGSETDILCLAVINGALYAGTSPGGRLYQWNGVDAWTQVAPQLGAETSIKSLIVYNGKLYGGTSPNGNLYEWNGADAWIERVGPALVHSLAFFNGKIYGGSFTGALYEWDSNNLKWVQRAPKLGSETDIVCLAEYNGKLYGGTSPNGKLYEWNTVDAWVEKAPQLGSETSINSLVVFNGKLYGGTGPNGKLYEWGGSGAWISRTTLGAGTSIKSLAVFNGNLYGGSSPGGSLYQWDGASAWILKAAQLGAETSINDLTVYGTPSKLYGGTGPNGRLYEWDGSGAWIQRAPVTRITSLVLFSDNKVYGGTSDGRLLQWDSGNAKWIVVAPQLDPGSSINCLAVFGTPSKIYAGTSPLGKLYQWDGVSAWVGVANRGAYAFTDITSLKVYNGKLYAGTNPGAYLCSWVSGPSWTVEQTATGETSITVLASGLSTKNKLYNSTSDTGGWTNGPYAVSSNNQYATHSLTATSNTRNPTVTSPGAGGWTNPTRAYADDGQSARVTANNLVQMYYGYGYALAANDIVSSVKIRLHAWASTPGQGIKLEVSPDGGVSWLTVATQPLATSETEYTFDVTGLTSWTPIMLNNIQTRVTSVWTAGTIRLDWIPVDIITSHRFTNFNNNPEGQTITKVEVGIEGYKTGNTILSVAVSWDNGVTWSTQTTTLPNSDPNSLTYLDFTGATTWDKTKLDNTHFIVQVSDLYQGAPSASTTRIDYICTRITSTANELYASSSPNTYLWTLTPSGGWTNRPGYAGENSILSMTFLNNNVYGCSSPGGYLLKTDTSRSSNSWTKVTDPPATQRVVSLLTDGTNLYGGTNPNGYLYKLTPPGSIWNSVVISQYPGENSILSMVLDSGNNLRAGTDINGLLLGVSGSNWVKNAELDSNSILSLCIFSSKLYGGTNTAGQLYEWDGASAWLLRANTKDGQTDINDLVVNTSTGKLYGAANPLGILFEWNPVPGEWINKITSTSIITSVDNLAVFNGNLYAGTSPGGRLYQWDGASNWVEKASKLGAETTINSLAVFNDKLYGGTSPGGRLYEWNGANTWIERAPKLGAETSINSLIIYNGKLFGGTRPNGKLYEWNGVGAWVDRITPAYIPSLAVYKNKIFGGTSYGALYEWDSTALKWVQKAPRLGSETSILSLTVFGFPSRLYAGTSPGGRLYQWNEVDTWVEKAPTQLTQTSINALVVNTASNKLYGGTSPNGCLLEWDGVSNWANKAYFSQVASMAYFNDKLYVGTSRTGELFEWNGINGWTRKASQLGPETSITSLAEFNGNLYAGTSPGGRLYQWDGVSAWTQKAPQLGTETSIKSLASYNEKLYGGTSPNGKLYEWNGVGAWVQKANTLNGQTSINSLLVFNMELFGGTSLGGRLFKWDGSAAWMQMAPQLGAETSINSLASYNSKLYGGTSPNGKLFEWNGVGAWIERAPKLGAETSINSIIVFNGKLFGGTSPNGKLFEWDTVDAWVEKTSTLDQQSDVKTLVIDSDSNRLCAGTLTKPFVFEFSDSSPRVATDFFKGYDNAWIRVSIVADYSGKKVQFYRNGVLFSTLTVTSGFIAPTASPIYVGSFANKGNYFKGYLDELRISTSARSDKWIATTYSNEANPENFYTMGTIESLSGLKLKVHVEDANGALPKTTLDVNLFYCYQGNPYPKFAQAPIKTVDTDQNGEAVINYPGLPTDITLFAAVRARYTNIYGVGYTTYSPKADMTPFVTSYENGQITLVHKKYLDAGYPYSGDLYYNATMVLPVGYSEFRNVQIANPTGVISSSTKKVIDLGALKSDPGVVMIFTKRPTGEYAVTVVPWGLTLGSHVTFGEAPLDATNVVLKNRLVMVGRYTYKVTMEMWRK